MSVGNTLRDYARNMDSEPSEFLNMLSEVTGKAVWLLSEDLEVKWHSDYTEILFQISGQYDGQNYCKLLPDFKGILEKIKENQEPCKGVYKNQGKEYEIACYPIEKDGKTKGYIVTLSNGIKSQLCKFIEKQKQREKLREKDLCLMT